MAHSQRCHSHCSGGTQSHPAKSLHARSTQSHCHNPVPDAQSHNHNPGSTHTVTITVSLKHKSLTVLGAHSHHVTTIFLEVHTVMLSHSLPQITHSPTAIVTGPGSPGRANSQGSHSWTDPPQLDRAQQLRHTQASAGCFQSRLDLLLTITIPSGRQGLPHPALGLYTPWALFPPSRQLLNPNTPAWRGDSNPAHRPPTPCAPKRPLWISDPRCCRVSAQTPPPHLHPKRSATP